MVRSRSECGGLHSVINVVVSTVCAKAYSGIDMDRTASAARSSTD